MSVFSTRFLENQFDFNAIDQTVEDAVRAAARDPVALYLFMHRYTHFNAYASAVIARLSSSIGLSRYLFKNSELLVTEEADRGMEIAAQIMSAAADEGTDHTPIHRSLAQFLLKTVGDYANLACSQRNDIAQIPDWLSKVTNTLVREYQGTPGDMASLVKAMGFHLASEKLGDREYALLDKVVRYENKDIGFDRYLKEQAFPVVIHGTTYTPWCWVVIHGKYKGSAAECEHLECAFKALNMTVRYSSVPERQIIEWAVEGFSAFVDMQQSLFREIHKECLDLLTQESNLLKQASLPSC